MTDRRTKKQTYKWITVGNAILNLDLKKCLLFSACPYSGPIALAYSNASMSWLISIRMSGGGVLKERLEVPDAVAMDWTRGHRLVILDHRGYATLVSSLGEKVGDFTFRANIREEKYVKFFSTTHDSGVAVVDEQYRIHIVNSVNEPVVWNMTIPAKEYPTAWTVFQPAKELTKVIVVLGRDFYSGSQGDTLHVQDTSWALSDGQYAKIAVSPSRLRLAVYHSSRIIQIVSTDLSTEICRINVQDDSSIYKFGWVGEDCVFLQQKPNFMQVFNVGEAQSSYEYGDGLFQVGIEHDGVKIYNDTKMEYLSTVTHEEKEVLELASPSDGALLHEASQLLIAGKSHKAYEYSLLVRDLPTAINHCTKVAALSWDTDQQKNLLAAARFGLAFVSSFDTNEFVKVIKELRVLNAIRTSRIGIPMSYLQYSEIGPSCLLNRLIDIGQYGTAIEICKWLKGDIEDGVDRVLLEWVRRTIKSAAAEKNVYEMDVDALEKKIYDKLSQYPHVSIADAATRAVESKLPKLARLLIKRETDDSKQVQVLLQLGDINEALSRAAQAQRPQLMHQVVRHLMAGQKRADYELSIRKIPMAQIVYQKLVREDSNRGHGKQMLALLEQASDFERLVMFHLDAANEETNPVERLNSLRQAKDAAQSLGDKGVAELLADMAAFAPSQTERSQDKMTIRETVIQFAADIQKVNQLKHQCKLSEKQVWLWTIEGLAKAGRMEQLFDMAQKKSPVGYVPFVKACVRYNRLDEAKKYAMKVTGYQDLVQTSLLMGNYIEAAKMAFDRRDMECLQLIYSKSHKNKDTYVTVGKLVKSMQQ